MPELPEVETIRRDLAARVVGARVEAVSVTGRRTIRREPPAGFVAGLTGRRLTGVRRHGKYLLAALDDGALLVCHLRMSGQLRLHRPGAPVAPHTQVTWTLSDLCDTETAELRFVDPRTFGECFLAAPVGPRALPAELAHLGIDPLEQGCDRAVLTRVCAGRRTSLKAVLLDQRAVAGIGNLYADEICFRARVRPDRPAGALTARELTRLADALDAVLAEAVAARGSSLRDEQYTDLFGAPGGYQDRHAVYGRAGEPCPRCGAPVHRVRLAGRSSHFCARCQR